MGFQGVTPDGLRFGVFQQRHVAGHQIRHQLVIQRQHHRFLNLRVFLQARFDLAQLDAQAANFHLMVDPAAVLDSTVSAITRQVASAVQPFATAKRVDHKALGRQCRARMVAPGQTRARQVQLANGTGRQGQQFRAEDVGTQVGNRSPDRHAVAVFFNARPVGHVDGRFGRPVQVVQRRLRQGAHCLALQGNRQRLAAAHNPSQRVTLHSLVAVDEGLQHRRHKMQGGNPLLDDQLCQLLRVAVRTRSGDHQRRAVHQRPEKLPHRHVKTERGFLQDPVGSVQAISLLHPRQPVVQRAMAVACAFGAAGGARGVDHIGQILGMCQVSQVFSALMIV